MKLSDSPLNLCSLFKVLVSYDVLKYCCISRAEHFLVDLITLGGDVTSHRGGAGWGGAGPGTVTPFSLLRPPAAAPGAAVSSMGLSALLSPPPRRLKEPFPSA